MRKLVFFGTQDWSAQLLECLVQDSFFEVVLVVTQPDKEMGRKKILTSPPVKQKALQYGLPVVQPKKLRDRDLTRRLKEIEADLSLIIAYGRMLPEAITSLYPFGTINVHPSLLPKWRGPSPVQAAIANGDTVSGVTIMKIDTQMDHGPILAQKKISIESNETFNSFMKKVLDVTAAWLPQTLKNYVEGSLVPIEQDHSRATICKLLTRKDGRIDWGRPAEDVERMIRAYHPWPGAWTEFTFRNKQIRIKILEARHREKVLTMAPGTMFRLEQHLYVTTGQGVIEFIFVQPEGKAPMPARAFLSGYAEALGGVLR